VAVRRERLYRSNDAGPPGSASKSMPAQKALMAVSSGCGRTRTASIALIEANEGGLYAPTMAAANGSVSIQPRYSAALLVHGHVTADPVDPTLSTS